MPQDPHVAVYLGPARSGKTQELVRQYAEALQDSPLARNLWLAPNARAAAEVRGQLLTGGIDACLNPGVMTFFELTRQILADARLRRY